MPKQSQPRKSAPARATRNGPRRAAADRPQAKRKAKVDGGTRAKDADVRIALDQGMQALFQHQVRRHSQLADPITDICA
jgi:hypothetical protein